ncbi:hypothetical protein HQN89_35930 [Paenibacillus frigoriresistens]|uniref:sensory rhodopsin transducer n=1 Tax=Paenibacillus alginolyticus TaxID=59839 RepID=UPI001565B018|nr:sensory rhodopsin transducer [Paenibacillus frigoriresistens]NRF96165.1 hypothetical protein [Paenibacillus frigoriresistens]
MSNSKIGALCWLIPDGFIPANSSGSLESHEAICLLNCDYEQAEVKVTIYFEDREPIEDIALTLLGRRTRHIRTDTLMKADEKIPKGIPYAMKVESNVPITVQHSRMDATQAENTLMTTIAYPVV